MKDGAPLPPSYRSILLYMMFVPWGIRAAGASIFVVLTTLLVIVPSTTSQGITLAAYWVVFMHSSVVFVWFAMGAVHISYYRSVLRQAGTD